jgi:hypothetical protein
MEPRERIALYERERVSQLPATTIRRIQTLAVTAFPFGLVVGLVASNWIAGLLSGTAVYASASVVLFALASRAAHQAGLPLGWSLRIGAKRWFLDLFPLVP